MSCRSYIAAFTDITVVRFAVVLAQASGLQRPTTAITGGMTDLTRKGMSTIRAISDPIIETTIKCARTTTHSRLTMTMSDVFITERPILGNIKTTSHTTAS